MCVKAGVRTGQRERQVSWLGVKGAPVWLLPSPTAGTLPPATVLLKAPNPNPKAPNLNFLSSLRFCMTICSLKKVDYIAISALVP